MKKTLIILSILLSLNAFADNQKATHEEKIAAYKAEMTAGIDKLIFALHTFKGCVSAAADRATIKTCRKTHREAMKALRPNKGK